MFAVVVVNDDAVLVDVVVGSDLVTVIPCDDGGTLFELQ